MAGIWAVARSAPCSPWRKFESVYEERCRLRFGSSFFGSSLSHRGVPKSGLNVSRSGSRNMSLS